MTSPAPAWLTSIGSTFLDVPACHIWWSQVLWKWRYQFSYQFLHKFLGKIWTHRLGPPERFSKSGIPIYVSYGWQKNEKKNSDNCKVLCVSNKSNKAFKLKDVTWIRSSKIVRVTLKIENTACKFSKKLCVTEIPIGMQNKNILIIIQSKVTINWVERTCKEIFKDGRVTRNRRYICQWGYI